MISDTPGRGGRGVKKGQYFVAGLRAPLSSPEEEPGKYFADVLYGWPLKVDQFQVTCMESAEGVVEPYHYLFFIKFNI